MNAVATSSASSSGSTSAAPASGTPGKTTTSSNLPADSAATPPPTAATTVITPLKAHVGETFVDGGSYVWRVEANGSFVCVAQPPGAATKSVGAKVTSSKTELWNDLCAMAIKALEPSAVPAPANDAAPAATTPANTNAPPPPASSGFSLDGFLDSLFAGGETLLDIGSQCVDLVTDALGLGANPAADPAAADPAAPAAAAPTPAPGTAPGPAADPSAMPAPAPAAPGMAPAAPATSKDKQLSGAEWRGIADKSGWPNSTSLGGLTGPFATGAATFVNGLNANGEVVKIVSTLRHDNRAALMHFSHTVGYGIETTELANKTCAERGIPIEWDHGDAGATKDAALALRAAFHIKAGVTPALHSRHCVGDAMDLAINNVPEQMTVGGKAYTAEPKNEGSDDSDKVDHIAKDFGVIWRRSKDDIHWSSDGT